jgi:hypothetical protein
MKVIERKSSVAAGPGDTHCKRETKVGRGGQPARRSNQSKVAGPMRRASQYRLLKWNEVVSEGDFVMDESRRFAPWQGPGGFRAGSFVKPIYRAAKRRPITIKESS